MDWYVCPSDSVKLCTPMEHAALLLLYLEALARYHEELDKLCKGID